MERKKQFLSALLALLMLFSVIAPIVPFTVSAAAAVGETPVVGRNYMIVSKNSGKAMTVSGNSANNDALIVQMPAEGYASQVWTLQDGGDGYVVIVNYFSGKAINIPYNSVEAGTQMIQWNNDGGDNEKWAITETADGYYRIAPKNVPGFGLNVSGASNDNGAAIIQWNYSGADNEKWSFVPVSQVKDNPLPEVPDPVLAIDAYIDMFFYVENGLGKLRNMPDNGFWTDAEVLEVFIDAYERLGDRKYLTVAEQFYDGIIARRGTNWAWNGFNDDILWMTLATIRLYQNTGNSKYLNVAKENFDLCYNRAWDTSVLGGGLWWTTDNQTKNACVNGPGALAALVIYETTGDRSYYDKGKAIVDWMIDRMYVADTGELYDNIARDGTITRWANTGNQGNLIGACAMLYKYTGNQNYFNVAKKAADLAATLGDGQEELLNEGSNSGDSIGGKGLMARWMGYFVRECNVNNYDAFINANAQSAWTLRNSDDLMWGEFGRKTEENIQNSTTQMNPNNSFVTRGNYASWGCSAAVSWLLNFMEVQTASGDGWTVSSPNGKTSINVKLSGNGSLTYTVAQDGVTVVETSDMGINTGIGNFNNGLAYVSESNQTINETYEMLSGKKSTITNYCREKTIRFTKGGVEFAVVVRAYNDGIAFRYVITTANGRTMTIQPNAENTSFNLPNGAQIWYMPRTGRDFMYEDQFIAGRIGQTAVGTQPSMPMLYETGGKYALITEADRHGNYVGSLLRLEGDGVLRTIFDLAQTSAVNTTTPFTSPWRTVIIGTPADIMENTMVENLSPAPDAQYDFESWVAPGMSSWSWVSYYGGQEDPNIHKKFIDLAADMGWEYYILDEKWQPASNTAGSRYEGMWDWFEEVRDYANQKGIKLFAWVDKLDVDTDAEREARFKEWSEAGIVGIKVDFFYNESQAMLQLHDDIYADAAKYKLMVNVHGSNPPSGELRTYPNVIAREAIAGQEQGGITVEQYTLIPFIRAAVGTADVTEQLFSRDTSKTTMGFQIALSTLFENGLHSMGDKPENYYSISAAVSYYTNFPAQWDDMYVLENLTNVGSEVNLARRSGDAWYAAGISVNAKDYSYRPTFLDPNTTYTAIIYKEVNGERQNIEMQVVNNVTVNTTLPTIHVQKGGGYAIKFIPQNSGLNSITANPANVSVEVYYTKDVTLNFNPTDTNSTDVIWTVADPSIAQVSATGTGASIKGLKAGTTTVTATSIYDGSKRAVINVTVTPAKYVFNDATWDVINDNNKYVISGENQVTITAETGVIDKNVFAMRAPDGNFEITAKISGGLNANYQGGFISVFTRGLNPYISIGRRFHESFGSYGNNNLVTMMSNNSEQYVLDPNANGDLYVRLVKNGNNFTGYYRVNANDAWTQAWTVENAALAGSEMYIGFYGSCGGRTNGIDITFSDFTYNGNAVKIANFNPNAVSSVAGAYEMENGAINGGALVGNAGASNGQHVGNLGGATNGTVSFNVASPASGKATIRVYYATYNARQLSVTVNGNVYNVNCVGTGDWTTVGSMTVEVDVVSGNNTIVFGGVDGGDAPNLDAFTIKFTEFSYEMENGTLNGVQLVSNAGASNGQHVGNVGGAANGTTSFNVESAASGKVTIRLYYATWSARSVSITVNGRTYTYDCPATGDWTLVGAPVSIEVDVTSGTNTIVFGGVDDGYAPNLDKFEIVLP